MVQKKPCTSLETELAQDVRGVALRQMQTRLSEGRARAAALQTRAAIHTVRAYDAANTLLPDIWRAMQRRN